MKHARLIGTLATAAALAVGATGGAGGAVHGPRHNARAAAAAEIALEQAQLYIEFNDTDNDLGFHVALDGEDWRSLKIVNPDGRTIFEVDGRGPYRALGMTEMFFEGAEPSLDEVPLDQLLALFPEGDYEFEGKTVDGESISGMAAFTHAIPDAPVIASPTPGVAVDPNNAVVDWNPVITPSGIQIIRYEVVVGGPVGESTFEVPASRSSLTIPPEILQPGTRYELEVLSVEVGHNQTITATSFDTL